MKTNANTKPVRSLLPAFIISMAALAPATVFAGQDALLKVNDIKVNRNGGELTVALDINPRSVNRAETKR